MQQCVMVFSFQFTFWWSYRLRNSCSIELLSNGYVILCYSDGKYYRIFVVTMFCCCRRMNIDAKSIDCLSNSVNENMIYLVSSLLDWVLRTHYNDNHLIIECNPVLKLRCFLTPHPHREMNLLRLVSNYRKGSDASI